MTEQPGIPKFPCVFVSLYHGREDPDEDMEAWGVEGPIFLFQYMHMVYRSLFFGEELEDISALFVKKGNPSDLIYYDGVYYGDMMIGVCADEADYEAFSRRIQKYDNAKATDPRT